MEVAGWLQPWCVGGRGEEREKAEGRRGEEKWAVEVEIDYTRKNISRNKTKNYCTGTW